MTRQQKQPGPDHPITVTPTDGTVRVTVGDRVIAESAQALTLQEASYPAVQYIPLSDVEPDVLRPSEHTTYCPFKGDASYYSLAVDGTELADSVWVYREPYEAVAPIADHVAFYPNVAQVSIG